MPKLSELSGQAVKLSDLQGAQEATYTPDQLASAFYQASDAGDQDSAQQIFHAIRQQGGTLRQRNQEEQARAQQAASQRTVNDQSGWQNFAAGAGKSVIDNYHGLQQLSAGLGSLLPSFLGGDYYSNAYQQLKDRQSDTNARDAALMQSRAGLAGNVAGQIGQAVVGGSALKAAGMAAQAPTYAQTAMSGGLQGLLQPLSAQDSEGQRGINAAFGAGAGVAGRGLLEGGASLLRNGAQAITGWLLPKASPEVAQLASSAINDYGIPLKASQVAPSRVAKVLDSVSGEVPFSGARQFGEAQQAAFNRAIAGSIGEDADNVTSNVFSRAADRIGAGYDDIAARNAAKVTPELSQNLAGIAQDATDLGSDESQRVVSGLLSRVGQQTQDGVIPGQAYQSIISQINKLSASGGEKAYYAGQIKDALKGAMENSLSGEDSAAWSTLNQQYRNLKTIEPLVAKDAYNGNISPSALLGRVGSTKAGKAALARDNAGDLGTLAAIGQNFIKDTIPNSGTPSRALGFGLLGGAGYAHPLSAISSVAGARGYQALMQSPQVLAKVLQDPSIDQATKSAIIGRLGAAGGLLGQQSALARQRYVQSTRVPALLQGLP